MINILSEKEKQLIKVVSLKKNETLFHENDKCEYIGFVLEGEIIISSYSYHGNEMIFNVIKKDMMFGNNLLFSSHPYYKGEVISTTNSKVGLIDKEKTLYLLQNNKVFLERYLQFQSNQTIKLNTKIKLLSFNNTEEKFLYLLYVNGNKYQYDSITKLAKELAVERETLSRLITKLEKKKIIKRNKKIITIVD